MQQAIAVEAIGFVVPHSAAEQVAVAGVALLPIAAFLPIHAIGALDVGAAKRSVPGAVAVGAEQVGFHHPKPSKFEVAPERRPVAAVVEEIDATKAADVGFSTESVVAVAAQQLGFEAEQIACIVRTAAAARIDRPLQHQLGFEPQFR